jgi:hypothetical protein
MGLRALWDAVNVWDVAKAFGRGMRWLFVGVKHRHEDVSYQAARKNSVLGGVDMDDLGQQPGGGKRLAGVDTAYGGGGMAQAAGAKSTDHLPIATEFRRSRFGMGHHQADDRPGQQQQQQRRGSDDAPAAEHAGLIAHAQPMEHSPARTEGGEYGEDDGYDSRSYGRGGRQEQQQPYEAPELQGPYPLHDRPSSLSTVEEESYSRAGSVAGGQYGPARGNPRNSTQLKIGNALWGGGREQS